MRYVEYDEYEYIENVDAVIKVVVNGKKLVARVSTVFEFLEKLPKILRFCYKNSRNIIGNDLITITECLCDGIEYVFMGGKKTQKCRVKDAKIKIVPSIGYGYEEEEEIDVIESSTIIDDGTIRLLKDEVATGNVIKHDVAAFESDIRSRMGALNPSEISSLLS